MNTRKGGDNAALVSHPVDPCSQAEGGEGQVDVPGKAVQPEEEGQEEVLDQVARGRTTSCTVLGYLKV